MPVDDLRALVVVVIGRQMHVLRRQHARPMTPSTPRHADTRGRSQPGTSRSISEREFVLPEENFRKTSDIPIEWRGYDPHASHRPNTETRLT